MSRKPHDSLPRSARWIMPCSVFLSGPGWASLSNSSQVTPSLLPTGSDYVISGNLSPDLGFGMFGVRRMGSKSQMALYTSQFDPHNPVSPDSPLRGLIERVSGAVNSPSQPVLLRKASSRWQLSKVTDVLSLRGVH